MYLFPNKKEMKILGRAINPTAQLMDYLYSRPPTSGSMAEFFMESEDIELAMEDDCEDYENLDFLSNPTVQHAFSWDEI